MLGTRAMLPKAVLGRTEFGVYKVSDTLQNHLVEELRCSLHEGDASVILWEVLISLLEEWNNCGVQPVRRRYAGS